MANGMPPARRRSAGAGPSPGERPRRSSGASARPKSEAKLVCIAGPSEGQEFTLSGAEAVIGRASENAVSIPDTSVSRRHVLLRRSVSGWAVSDMGSGNGTLVNGEAITDETPLRSGDVITLGETELSFVDGQGAQPVAPTSGRDTSDAPVRGNRPRAPRHSRHMRAVDPNAAARQKKVVMWVVLGVLLVVSSLAGIKFYQAMQQQKLAAEQEAANEKKRALAAHFQEGKNLVREGKWREAKAKFEEMQQLNPDYPTLADYLARADKEIPNQENLALAEQHLDKRELSAAAKALEKVSSDTTSYQQLKALRDRFEEVLDARIKEAQALLLNDGSKDLKRMRALKAISEDILAATPEQRDASQLKQLADEAITELTRPKPPPRKPEPKPWLEVSKRFEEGDLSGAFSLANECAPKAKQCSVLVGQLDSYNAKYKRLESLSAKELIDLMALDEKISGGGMSVQGRKVGTRLAGQLYKSAAAAKAAGEWGRAVEYARRTLKADPGHAGAQAIAVELRGKAKDLFLQAYQLKGTDPDEAIKLFKEVIAMTPKDDENHAKAKNWLEKLQR